MKKLPVLLLTLTLLAPSSAVWALEVEPIENNNMTTNYLHGSVLFDTLYLGRGRLDLHFNYWNDGRRPRRLLMAGIDYLSGVSESEADRLAESLGVGEASWAAFVSEAEFPENMSTRAYTELELPQNLLTTNAPDILYYAVEFADPSDTEKAPEWIRGKVDYRRCAHNSEANESWEARCLIAQDSTNQTYSFTFDGASNPNEEVLTWEDELTLLAEAKVDGFEVELVAAETRKANGEVITSDEVSELSESLAQVREQVAKFARAEALAERLAALEGRITALTVVIEEDGAQNDGKNEGENGGGDDGEEIEESEDEEDDGFVADSGAGSDSDSDSGSDVGSGSDSGAGSDSDSGSGSSSSAGVSSGTTTGSTADLTVDLTTEVENAPVTVPAPEKTPATTISAIVSTTVTSTTSASGAAQGETASTTGENEAKDEVYGAPVDVQDTTSGDGGEVAVPMLGGKDDANVGADKKWRTLLAISLLGVSALGVTSWWTWRAFWGGKAKHKRAETTES